MVYTQLTSVQLTYIRTGIHATFQDLKVHSSPPANNFLDWVCECQLSKQVHGVLPVGVGGESERDEAIEEGEEGAGVQVVLWPLEARGGVRVQSSREMDEIVGHVAASIDIEDVCRVRGSEDGESFETLAHYIDVKGCSGQI